MNCLRCDEPDLLYIPSDDIADYGLYSCGTCDFEFEAASERTPRSAPVSHSLPRTLGRPISISLTGRSMTPYTR